MTISTDGQECLVITGKGQLLRFLIECATSIATGLVALPVFVSGHSVDSGVGSWQLRSIGARGSDICPSSLIHCPVVPIKGWVWPSVLLALGNVIFVVTGDTFRSRTLTGIRWIFLAAFFALTAAGLFSYLRSSRSVAQAELYTAANIYLVLGLLWATIYLVIDAFSPGSIHMGSDPGDRQTELLYFSLITLSTVGYGNIVPLTAEARILAALEGVTGVLYIAITVALLVSRFRSEFSD